MFTYVSFSVISTGFEDIYVESIYYNFFKWLTTSLYASSGRTVNSKKKVINTLLWEIFSATNLVI